MYGPTDGGAGSPPSIPCPACITPPLARRVLSLTHLPGPALQYTRADSALKQGGADMEKSQRATHQASCESGVSLISSDTSGQSLSKRVEELELQHAAWELKRKQILFFFALILSGCLCASSLKVVAGTFPIQLQIGAGVYLASVGTTLLRFLLGSTPPLILLIAELVKVLTANKKVHPLE